MVQITQFKSNFNIFGRIKKSWLFHSTESTVLGSPKLGTFAQSAQCKLHPPPLIHENMMRNILNYA